MEDIRSIAYALNPTTDFLNDYMLRSFKSEGKNRSGSTPYRDKRNRKKKNKDVSNIIPKGNHNVSITIAPIFVMFVTLYRKVINFY